MPCSCFCRVRHGNRPLSPSPDHLEREAFVDAQIRKLETELLHYVDVPQGSLIQIDESMAGQTEYGFEELQPKRAQGKNVSGTGQGQSSDAGDSSRLPNISGGSLLVGSTRPFRFRAVSLIGTRNPSYLVAGELVQSHATDAYVLDRWRRNNCKIKLAR